MKKVKVQIFQHEDFSPAGTTIDWLEKNNIDYRLSRLDKSEDVLSPESIDWLIVCGGDANVDQEELYPWLIKEKQYIRKCLEMNKTILGICLGGQLLAEALGAQVKPHTQWEVGWHEVSIPEQNKNLVVFQWHGYTFDLPEKTELFATNDICKNQGFRYGKKVIGLQFHPETNLSWVKECAETPIDVYPKGTFVQSGDELLQKAFYQPGLQQWYFSLLDQQLKTL